jgi:hypothetical protein
VAARQHAGERESDLRLLAEDDPARGGDDAINRGAAGTRLEFGLEEHATIVTDGIRFQA